MRLTTAPGRGSSDRAQRSRSTTLRTGLAAEAARRARARPARVLKSWRSHPVPTACGTRPPIAEIERTFSRKLNGSSATLSRSPTSAATAQASRAGTRRCRRPMPSPRARRAADGTSRPRPRSWPPIPTEEIRALGPGAAGRGARGAARDLEEEIRLEMLERDPADDKDRCIRVGRGRAATRPALSPATWPAMLARDAESRASQDPTCWRGLPGGGGSRRPCSRSAATARTRCSSTRAAFHG